MRKYPGRPDPMKEGVAEQIYKWFLGKLVFQKPESLSIKEWLEELFDTRSRDIVRWRVVKPFRMPGLLYVAGTVKVQGIGYRDIREKTFLWARTDARQPDSVDVEVNAGQGQKEHVYNLTENEWDWVKLHLEPSLRKPRKVTE